MADQVVWKFPIPGPSRKAFTLQLPRDAKVLTVGLQADEPYVWVQVDPDQEVVERAFRVVATGKPFPLPRAYVGTFMFHDGATVFHLFEDWTYRDHQAQIEPAPSASDAQQR